ncbi:hypothetical protein QEH59_18885, partial [Coraliomargarita sp. SDUM461004]
VAVGANGTILRSVDGATWTKQPLSGVAANTNFQDIIWTGDAFYAVGASYDVTIEGWNGVICKSETGQTWTLDYQVPSEQTALAYNKNSELMGISYDANSTLV